MFVGKENEFWVPMISRRVKNRVNYKNTANKVMLAQGFPYMVNMLQ